MNFKPVTQLFSIIFSCKNIRIYYNENTRIYYCLNISQIENSVIEPMLYKCTLMIIHVTDLDINIKFGSDKIWMCSEMVVSACNCKIVFFGSI